MVFVFQTLLSGWKFSNEDTKCHDTFLMKNPLYIALVEEFDTMGILVPILPPHEMYPSIPNVKAFLLIAILFVSPDRLLLEEHSRFWPIARAVPAKALLEWLTAHAQTNHRRVSMSTGSWSRAHPAQVWSKSPAPALYSPRQLEHAATGGKAHPPIRILHFSIDIGNAIIEVERAVIRYVACAGTDC